jgi:hypothetical protein
MTSMSFGSYPCPNNVWNHTTGCACVPNGSMTSEAADIDLTPAPVDVPITAEMVTTYLGDGPDLTPDEERILGILLDPRNHADTGFNGADGEVMLEEIDGLGNETDNYSVKQIAGFLDAHYAREAYENDPENYRAGTMAFSIPEDGGAYNVEVYLGSKMGGDYLSSHHDMKYLDPERYFTDETTGLRKAVHFAKTIDDDFQAIRARAIRLGLVKNPKDADREQSMRATLLAAHAPSYLTDRQAKVDEIDRFIDTARPFLSGAPVERKSPWPETDDERAAFADWQREAAEGDTNAGFRDWYDNPDRNMDDED